MPNGRTLQVGKDGAANDTIYVRGNTTENGTASDLRLPESSNVNSNSVDVLCPLHGEVRVVNAKNKGTQFGHTGIEYVGGFSDLDHVFIADDDLLYGTIDRADNTHKKIIWGTEPICKITDDRGRLLNLKIEDSAFPAVFDYLDRNNGTGNNEVSAFGIIRAHDPANNVKLYNADGTPYAGTTYQVKMLVENYTADSAIVTPNDASKTVILTTAGGSDSLYPYRGRKGTRATVLRGTNTGAMVTVKSNLTMTNIVLDSGSKAGATSRILLAETADTTIRLGKNAALQNATLTGNAYGAGVRLDNGAALIIEGGAIRDCSSEKSGGGVQVRNGSLTFTGGNITRCSAVEDGGGVYFEKGTFTMSGGSITRCTAQIGAGVFVAAGKAMTMSGGSISGNSATDAGGGIAVGSGDSRLYFSGAATVYGNTLNGNACNVQMDQGFTYGALNEAHASDTTVIVSRGLMRGATIGVYVPDDSYNSSTLYDLHGIMQKPFATYADGTNTSTLNYFINDRNQLKGGLYETQTSDNYMVYWVKIYTLKVSKVVMSDETADSDKEFSFTVQLTGEAAGTLAIDFNGTYGEMTFTNGKAEFTLKSGEHKIAEKLPLGYGYTVTENLLSEEQAYYITSPSTTQTGTMYVETRYLYEVTFNNLHAICKITDVDHGLLYYYDSNNNLRPAIYSKLQNAFNALISTHFFTESGVSVDVNTDKTRVEMLRDYALGTNEEEDTTFKANTKAILTTADKNAHDGYSYVGAGTIATISRGYDGASLITVKGDLRLGNIILDGDSSHHTANTNGGILNVSSSGKLTVGSGTMIQNSTTSGSGAGVYLAEGNMMYISGGPVFANNLATVTLAAGSTNGNENYTDAKQDVFIAGYSSGDAQSLIVTGNISLSPGSIWVWAENQRHYEQSKQFAIMQNGTNYSGLSAFRNARTDAETKNPLNDNPLYLYGVKRGTDGKEIGRAHV